MNTGNIRNVGAGVGAGFVSALVGLDRLPVITLDRLPHVWEMKDHRTGAVHSISADSDARALAHWLGFAENCGFTLSEAAQRDLIAGASVQHSRGEVPAAPARTPEIKTYKFSTLSDALSAARAAAEIAVQKARGRGLRAEWLRADSYITGYHGGDRLDAETRGFTVDPSVHLRLQFQVLRRKARGTGAGGAAAGINAELLAALELILKNSKGPIAFYMNRKELAGVARAAIAKARGAGR